MPTAGLPRLCGDHTGQGRPPVTAAGSSFCGVPPRQRAGNLASVGLSYPWVRRTCPFCLWCQAQRSWPAGSTKHFTSWLGLCPNFKKTGGKVQSSRTRRGKGRAAHTLRLAAWSLMRSKAALGAYLRRQRARLGAPKAITATAHKLARIVNNLVRGQRTSFRSPQRKRGPDPRLRCGLRKTLP
jgi:Transposase IS116/IS110/IS902 family